MAARAQARSLAARGGAWLRLPLAAGVLCWPAFYNAYPIVFADTGTYLSQAINHYLGWDRPAFYSLAMLPLHLMFSTWPVVFAQAFLTTCVVDKVRAVLAPAFPLLPLVGMLAVGTWLPWLVSELMPDLLTPLLVLVLCLLLFDPRQRPRAPWVALATFAMAAQQSSLLLYLIVMPALGMLAWRSGASAAGRHIPVAFVPAAPVLVAPVLVAPVLVAPVLAVMALCMANLAGHGRLAVSPFGNVFLLARVIYDGPGMNELIRSCPAAGWRLCPFLDRFPPTSDAFLWLPDSPLNIAGGAKLVSSEANAVISAAVLAEPGAELRAFLANGWEQSGRFASGDGLEPWPTEVTPWIEKDFPLPEARRYRSAKQQRGSLHVVGWMAALHRLVAIGGLFGCIALLPAAWQGRRARQAQEVTPSLTIVTGATSPPFAAASPAAQPLAPGSSIQAAPGAGLPAIGFLAAALLALPASALITGGLSTPHDRYQARIVWIPAFVALLVAANQRRSA